MARSSIMGGERAPQQAKGRSSETLGPSDTSDSGRRRRRISSAAHSIRSRRTNSATVHPKCDRKARAKDREDRRKFALTFAVSVAGLLIAFFGLVFVVLTFAAGGG